MKTTIQTASATGYRGNRFENADPLRVAELVEAMLAEGYDQYQPVIVVDGAVANGRHRVLAALAAGIDEIPAIVVDEERFLQILEECDDDLERASIVVEYEN